MERHTVGCGDRRERERERDRQTDRQTDRQRQRETERDRERQRETERQRDRETEKTDAEASCRGCYSDDECINREMALASLIAQTSVCSYRSDRKRVET